MNPFTYPLVKSSNSNFSFDKEGKERIKRKKQRRDLRKKRGKRSRVPIGPWKTEKKSNQEVIVYHLINYATSTLKSISCLVG